MKKLIPLILFLVSPLYAEGPLFSYKDATTQQEFENVYQDIRNVGRSFNVQGSFTVAHNTTITGNFVFPKGSIVTVNTGVSLIINGTVEAGLYQIFNLVGTGQVYFQHNSPGVHTGNTTTDIVYPEWWGAKGDGATDDVTPIQAAVNAYERGWGKIVFSAKQYLITSTITVSASYETLEGVIPQWRAQPSVLPNIVSNSSTNDVILITSGGTDGVLLKGLAVTRAFGVYGSTGSKTIDVQTTVHVTLDHMSLGGSQYPFYGNGTGGMVFNDVSVAISTDGNGVEYGIYMDGSVTANGGYSMNEVGILGNAVQSDTVYGVADIQTCAACGAGDRRLIDVHGSGITNYPIYIKDSGGWSHDVFITNTSFDTVTSTGISLISSSASYLQSANISGGFLNLSGTNAVGVYIDNRQQTSTRGYKIAPSANTQQGIVYDGSSYNKAVDNDFFGTATSFLAFNLKNSSTNNQILGNVFQVPSTTTFSSNSNNNTIDDSTCTVTDAGTGNVNKDSWGTFVTTTSPNTLAAGSNTWTDAASMVLTKGEWNISLNSYVLADAGTTVTATWTGIGTVSGGTSPGGASNNSSLQYQTFTAGQENAIAIPPYHVSITASTTYYLKGLVVYSGGTAHFGGTMSAIKTK